MAQRKLVCGVGTNDVDYQVTVRILGVKYRCPYYKRWTRMLERCYSEKGITDHPSYINCIVSDRWLVFSNFRAWMKTQDWENKELDKDILIPGNKKYSEDTCKFVSVTENRSHTLGKIIVTTPRAGAETVVNGIKFNSAGAAAKFIHNDSGRSNIKDISRRIRKFLANDALTTCTIYEKYIVG